MFGMRFDTKKTIIILVCICVLVLGIVLRADRLLFVEQNYAIPDLNRDLLVGYHIATYNEFTLIGPDSTSGLPLYNSSLFFVLTAITGVLFGFTTIGINIGNMVYQLLAVGLIFGTTRNLFNTKTAIIAGTLMLLFDIFINQSRFFWQPHLMQVVYMASLYALSVGYVKKNEWYIYLSIFLFAASIGTHYPPILVTPVFGIAVWMVLYSHKAPVLNYLYTAVFGVLSMVVVFGTALLYKFTAPVQPYIPTLTDPDFSLGEYVQIALSRTEYLISYYLPKADTPVLQYLACIILICGCVWYYRTVQDKKARYACGVLIAGVTAVIFGVTVTHFPYESFVVYPLRYYTAIYAPLTMLIAVILVQVWEGGTRIHKIVAGSMLALVLFAGGSYFGEEPIRPLGASQHSLTQFHFNDKGAVTAINTAMLEVIQRRDIAHDFDVVTFDGEDAFFMNERADDIIWFPLELMTKEKLVSLDELALRSYSPTPDPTYILVRCREVSEARCLSLIGSDLPEPYTEHTVIVEQLTKSPDPAYLLSK